MFNLKPTIMRDQYPIIPSTFPKLKTQPPKWSNTPKPFRVSGIGFRCLTAMASVHKHPSRQLNIFLEIRKRALFHFSFRRFSIFHVSDTRWPIKTIRRAKVTFHRSEQLRIAKMCPCSNVFRSANRNARNSGGYYFFAIFSDGFDSRIFCNGRFRYGIVFML